MARAEFFAQSYQDDEITLQFSVQYTSAGVASLVRGGGGKVKTAGNLTAGVGTITLNVPYPYQMLAGSGSVAVAAGVSGKTVEVDTASYDPTTGTVTVRHVSAGAGAQPAATCRISYEFTFLKYKVKRYA